MSTTTTRKIQIASIGIVTAIWCTRLLAVEQQPAAVKVTTAQSKPIYPEDVFRNLRLAHADGASTFVFEKELDDLIDASGGGACASAAGINALQALRVMAGRQPLQNPHKAALAAFVNQKELLKGRVSNEQFVRLLQYYSSYSDSAGFRIDVQSASNSPYASGGQLWPASGPDLEPASEQLTILSYTVTEKNGFVPGRHFVLLQQRRKNEVTVLDPNNPVGERRYILEFRAAENGTFDRIYLLQPAGTPVRDRTYELNTVFRITLSDLLSVSKTSKPSPITIGSIKQSIDRTAAELRGKESGVSPTFISPRLWREKTASDGLPGLDLPVELGGSAWSSAKMLEVFRHAGRHNLNFRDVVGGAHVRPLLNSTNPGVLDVVRQVIRGEAYIAIAMTEPEVGSNFRSITSSATKVDGGYLLTGEKRYVARLKQATHVIVFTQAATGKVRELSAFLLPMNSKGLEHVPLEAHGLLGNSFGGIKFKDLFVPSSHLIGEDGKGVSIFTNHFRYWRLMQVATAIGTGEGALDQMQDRLKTREAYGAPIGRFTHLQQGLGQSTIELEMALSLARRAATLIDEGNITEADRLISGLKAEGVEISLRAVDTAVRAYGGEGYSNRVDLGDRLRDLNGLRIADGTTDVMRMDVVRRTYGQEFWEMGVRSGD